LHSAERDKPDLRAAPSPLDQLWGRQTLCSGLEPPMTGMLIVRYNGWEGFTTGYLGPIGGSSRVGLGRFEPRDRRGGAWPLPAFRVRTPAGRGQNSAEREDAEKSPPAKIAAISGNTEPALQGDYGSVLNTLAGDAFKIKISAFRTVRITAEYIGNAPGVEAFVTCVTSPGFVSNERRE
jgi:hypothetical protein